MILLKLEETDTVHDLDDNFETQFMINYHLITIINAASRAYGCILRNSMNIHNNLTLS